MDERRRASWRTALILVPPGISAVVASVDPALLIAGAAVALLALGSNPVLRTAGAGLAIGALSGPGLELPLAWIPLIAAGLLAEGRRRVAALPAIAGLVVALTWGMDPGLWPIAAGLAALCAGVAGAESPGLTVPVLVVLAGIGGFRASRVSTLVEGAAPSEIPALAEQFGAAWIAPEAERALEEAGWFDDEGRRRDRARLLAELGGGRLAFRSLGFEALPGWERAALLNQIGRTVPALVLGLTDGPDDPARGPGVVFERADWTEGELVVVPILLSGSASELVLEARGEFFLGAPRLAVQIAGQRLGPLDIPEEGGEWALPVALGPGVHRLTVAFDNPHRSGRSVRALAETRISLR